LPVWTNHDPFPRIFSQYVYPAGIVVVCAGHNKEDQDVNAFEPSCPTERRQVVVGAVRDDGFRWTTGNGEGSGVLDTGVLVDW